MNKSDFFIVIILVILMGAWMYINPRYISPPLEKPLPTKESIDFESKNTSPSFNSINDNNLGIEKDNIPEKFISLNNDLIEVSISSKGGGIVSSKLYDFKSEDKQDSSSVILDFKNLPALTYNLIGLDKEDHYNVIKNNFDTKEVKISKKINDYINFERIITLGEDYLINVQDTFINISSNLQELPNRSIHTGFMSNSKNTHKMMGESILGVDSYSLNGGIEYWGKPGNINKKVFPKKNPPSYINITPKDMENELVEWVSAKNKFFVQILHPIQSPGRMRVLCYRDNDKNPTSISSGLDFKNTNIKPNESLVYTFNYYVGPRDYYILKNYDQSYEKTREFETTGFWSGWNIIMEPIRIGLNWSLIQLNNIIPGGYGMAIILLTIIIRILFHPLHKKSTDSMKRMQEIQPEIKSLQEKYQKDPKRLQQETMILYKNKKVNPMGGCLPMFIQIPIFIALYTILRGAIELRFVDFLWINDLSGPENLFAGKIPIPFNSNDALNILPILMSVSMVFQQKMTSAATAITPEQKQQQQMMMIMMPLMMLFFFYDMPSGLVLYWTISNLLMIGMTGFKNFKNKAA